MPQQFYLTADAPSYTPTTWKGAWDQTADAVNMRLDSTKTTADVTKYTIQRTYSEETFATLAKVALIRYISGPLKAQTISGTMQLMAGVWQSDALADLYYAVHMYATQGDTDLVRCTLIANFSEGETDSTIPNVFPTTAKGRDLLLSAAITSGSILDDDRIVVEIGYSARNLSATAYTGALFYGTDFYSNGSPDMQRDA